MYFEGTVLGFQFVPNLSNVNVGVTLYYCLLMHKYLLGIVFLVMFSNMLFVFNFLTICLG